VVDMTIESGLSLIIGGYSTGKTTALVQLFGRLRSADSSLRIVNQPASLEAVRSGLAALASGRQVSHTPAGTEVLQELQVRGPGGSLVEISIPDYDGESIDSIVEDRRVPESWRQQALHARRWILFVRLDRMEPLPEFLSVDAGAGLDGEREQSPMPLDLRLVELLQILGYERARASRRDPELLVVLSCWDELTPQPPETVTPTDVLSDRMPLLHSFVTNRWSSGSHAVVGLSSQGRVLVDTTPDQDFINRGPDQMGYLVRSDATRTDDLTELLLLP